MGDFKGGFISKSFKLSSFNELTIANYRLGYGETKNSYGDILYKTEGRLIPWTDFEYTLLFNGRD